MAMFGYEIAIHRSLTEQILLGGVPRSVAILNGTLMAALGLGMHSYYSLPIGLVLHLLAVVATKKDPQFFDCLKRHLTIKDHYQV